jgi:hypothetical protein
VENPSNAKEKNHGHQPATISLYQEFGLHAYGGLQENQVCKKPYAPAQPSAFTGLRFAPSEARAISCSEFGTTPTFDAWLDQVEMLLVAHEVEDLIDEHAYLTAQAVDTSSFFKRKFHHIKNIAAWQMFSSQVGQVEARIQRLAEMRNRYGISVGELDRRNNLQLANQLCMSDSSSEKTEDYQLT